MDRTRYATSLGRGSIGLPAIFTWWLPCWGTRARGLREDGPGEAQGGGGGSKPKEDSKKGGARGVLLYNSAARGVVHAPTEEPDG